MRKLILAVIVTLTAADPAMAQGWTSSLSGDVTLSGVAALFPRGSDARPTIAVQQDTDTGIRFPAAGQISFVLDGTRRVLFDASGFLINTTYLNFGATAGTTGYGLRDNSGVMQFKDSGGSWIAIAAAASGAPITATYLTQTSDATLSNEQALSSLSSGIMRVATTTGVVTSLTTSAGIAANISDETGSGLMVFDTSPTLTTPTLTGSVSGSPSITGAWTFGAGSVGIRDTDNTHNLVLTPGSNLTANRILRLTTGDAERTLTISGDTTLNNWFDQDVRSSASPTFNALTVTSVTNNLSVFAATTSAQLAGVISNETGTGLLVFGTTPTLTTPVLGAATGTSLNLSAGAVIGTSLDISAAGAGQITFPAAQNASAGANVLDDFEEGPFTPAIGGSGGQSGQVYAVQVGRYTKTGKQVCVQGRVQLSTLGTITTNVQLQGLPFAADATSGYRFSGSLGEWNSFTTSYVGLWLDGVASATVMTLYGATAATTGNAVLAQANLTANTAFTFSGCYAAAN